MSQSKYADVAIEKLLSKGAQGEVHKLKDQAVVAKVPLPGNDATFEMLKTESAMLQAVKDKTYVVNHLEFDATARRLYMEYVVGQTLKDYLSKMGVPKGDQLDAVKNIFLQVAKGLQAIHNAGIAHTDIKPDNIMVTADLKVKIIDFGLAREQSKEAEIQQTGVYYDTKTRNGVARDLYGLGVMICKTFNGTIANYLQNTHEVKDIPRGFNDVVKECTKAKPEERSLANVIALLEKANKADPLSQCCVIM